MTVKFRTPQLEHEFGCPYQLGHHRYANSPCDADLAALPVVSGDVIIMGSDGLLDNMSELEVVAEVSRLIASGAKPGAMAQRIAKVGGGMCGCGSVCRQVACIQRLQHMAAGLWRHTCAQDLGSAFCCGAARVQVAFDNSIDKHRVTPYSRAATEAFDMVYSGGKPDDITVLVAVIS